MPTSPQMRWFASKKAISTRGGGGGGYISARSAGKGAGLAQYARCACVPLHHMAWHGVACRRFTSQQRSAFVAAVGDLLRWSAATGGPLAGAMLWSCALDGTPDSG